MKWLTADKYLSISNLKASTEREKGNPVLPTRFQAILGAIGQEVFEFGQDRVSRQAI